MTTVFVETSARLHFGVLDLRGDRGRWFGGLGAAAPAPSVRVSASNADLMSVEGEDAPRASAFATRFMRFHNIQSAAAITVHQTLPSHAGLGSGTQLALAVARALAELHGVDPEPASLSLAVGRGRRSAIGTWTFAGGGLVVEGGKARGQELCGPLIARIPFPPSWRCVVAIPRGGAPAISGAHESALIERLPAPPQAEVERMSHLVLMVLLPALADGDLPAFGGALTELQWVTGQWWAPVQGATFAAGATGQLVGLMSDCGAAGVGQSSWGPTVYGIVDGAAAGAKLAAQVRDVLGEGGAVYEGPFPAEGARVWRA